MACIAIVVGVRPHFVKLAALFPHLTPKHEVLVIHSGQHYDYQLSGAFFNEFGLPQPGVHLSVGSGTAAEQVAAMLTALGPILAEAQPRLVCIIGDTNTSLAGALAAAQCNIPVAHIEAGVTNGDLATPEEVNRRVIDSISSLYLCPTLHAATQLGSREGIHFVGDLLLDMVKTSLPIAREKSNILSRYALTPKQYLLVTVHHPSNLRSYTRCKTIVDALRTINEKVIFSMHPGSKHVFDSYGLLGELQAASHITISEPLTYFDMLTLQSYARLVASDSNGIQRESYFVGTPCIILLPNTEYLETVHSGGARILDPVDKSELIQLIQQDDWHFTQDLALFGNGQAATRIVNLLL